MRNLRLSFLVLVLVFSSCGNSTNHCTKFDLFNPSMKVTRQALNAGCLQKKIYDDFQVFEYHNGDTLIIVHEEKGEIWGQAWKILVDTSSESALEESLAQFTNRPQRLKVEGFSTAWNYEQFEEQKVSFSDNETGLEFEGLVSKDSTGVFSVLLLYRF